MAKINKHKQRVIPVVFSSAQNTSLVKASNEKTQALHLRSLLQSMQNMFYSVRLVEANGNCQVEIDENGEISKTPYKCYCALGRNERCGNCISVKCICKKERADKFEFLNDDIFYVTAQYIEIGEQAYALEIVNKVTDETLIGGYGKDKIIKEISAHNKRLFVDSLTEAYNRHYYDEQVSGLSAINAIAMIDVDNFKTINDTYGHQVGDEAIKLVTRTLKSCVRKSDAVVRYGGDEFAIIFRDIDEDMFIQKLDMLRSKIHNLPLEDTPEVKVSISVGGAYGPDYASTLLHKADKRMYREKRAKKYGTK